MCLDQPKKLQYTWNYKQGVNKAQPIKMILNKKLDPKQKTIQTFNIDAQGFGKIRNENPPTWEIGVTS